MHPGPHTCTPALTHAPRPSHMHPDPHTCTPALTHVPRPSHMYPGPLMWPRILSHAGCLDAPPCSSSVPELRARVCCTTPGLRSLRSCAPCCSCWPPPGARRWGRSGHPPAEAAATAGRGLGDACTCARGGGHWRWIRGSLDQGVTGSGSVMHWLDLGGSGSGFGVHMRSGGHWIWIWREC